MKIDISTIKPQFFSYEYLQHLFVALDILVPFSEVIPDLISNIDFCNDIA